MEAFREERTDYTVDLLVYSPWTLLELTFAHLTLTHTQVGCLVKEAPGGWVKSELAAESRSILVTRENYSELTSLWAKGKVALSVRDLR